MRDLRFHESLEEELAQPIQRKGKQQPKKHRKRTPAMMAGLTDRSMLDSKGHAVLSFTVILIKQGLRAVYEAGAILHKLSRPKINRGSDMSEHLRMLIAEKLVLAEGTVRAHMSSVLSKLHLANRTQTALYTLREGLASL
jgi:hypothetical protein